MSRVIYDAVVLRCSSDGRAAYVKHGIRLRHKLYGKVVVRSRVYCVETYGVECVVGDKVCIVEVPPVSKKKRWGLKVDGKHN